MEMFSRRSLNAAVLGAVSLAIVLGAPGCGAPPRATRYKVGVILSLSGPSAPLGQPEERSIKLVASRIRKAGGLDGIPLEFVIKDDESEPQKANAAVAELINQEKVDAVIGCSSTGSTLATVTTVDKEMIPTVAMAAGTRVTQPVKKWVFSVAPSDALVIERALIYIRDVLKVRNVAILHDSNAYGTGGADELKKQAPSYSINIVADKAYGSADTNMTPQLTKIAETDAQVILVWGTNPGPASIAQNMQQLGIDLPFVGSSGIANKKFIELAGSAANGVVFPASRLILPSTIPAGSSWARAVEEFSAEYRAAYNMDIDTFAAHGWDAANIVTYSLAKSRGDKAGTLKEIEKLKGYPGVDGVFTFSKVDHAGLGVDALVMVKIENGQWVPAQ